MYNIALTLLTNKWLALALLTKRWLALTLLTDRWIALTLLTNRWLVLTLLTYKSLALVCITYKSRCLPLIAYTRLALNWHYWHISKGIQNRSSDCASFELLREWNKTLHLYTSTMSLSLLHLQLWVSMLVSFMFEFVVRCTLWIYLKVVPGTCVLCCILDSPGQCVL